MLTRKLKGFTLVELLVVISVIGILMAVLVPALAAARSHGRSLVCKSNLRQILMANISYASENDDSYVPAASDMWDNSGHYRWHGARDSLDEPFDPTKGPLITYFGNGQIKECPEKIRFLQGQDWDSNFEQGCGGYGYNMIYLGSRTWKGGFLTIEDWKNSYRQTTHTAEVARPSETLMFADTAISTDGLNLIEYSFAEPPFYVSEGNPITSFYLSPSIHFRHRDLANVGWADGHVDSREMAKFDKRNAYGVSSDDMNLGWFEPLDNTPFDLK